jgi:hypothetical protein
LNIDTANIDPALDKMEKLAEMYEDAIKIKSAMFYIKTNPTEFSPKAAISTADTVLVEDTIVAIKNKASDCKNDYNKCDASQIASLKIRLPERLTWIPFDETNIAFQQIGIVPQGESRVLEVKGLWNCHENIPSCWIDAANTIQFQVINNQGAVVESGATSGGTALISAGGAVKVRVADGPGVPEFKDNTHDPGHPLKAALW